MQKVDFRRNECSAWFPEYAAVLVANAVSSGQHLMELDGEAVKLRGTKEILATAEYIYSNLDQYVFTGFSNI